MPGELANCIAGRVANLFNFHGPNFTTDAACASGAGGDVGRGATGLQAGDFDAAITGGIDRNMGATAFVKFCKIGALSATGTRPFDDGADGFVMGEGAALFVLKRLADAERDGDRIYAVLRGVGGSSDGKGKGITAPNPVGQRLAVERAWHERRCRPGVGHLHRGARHVDARRRRRRAGQPDRGVPQGRRAPTGRSRWARSSRTSATSRARPAPPACFKAVLSLHDKVLPPSLHFEHPNPKRRLGRHPVPRSTPSCASGRRPRAARAAPASARSASAAPTSTPCSRSTCPAGTAPRMRSRSFAGATIEHQSTRPTRGIDARRTEGAAAGRRGRGRRRRRRGGRPARGAGRRGVGRACARPGRTGPRPGGRGGAGRDRLRRRRRPGGQGGQGAEGAAGRQPGGVEDRCAPRASSSAAAHRARSRSSTPARARSTSTCCATCASGSRSSPRRSPRPTGSWRRCSASR